MNFNLNLTSYVEINAVLIQMKTITCFEEKTGEHLQKLGLGEEFLDMTQRHDPVKNKQATDWQ